MNQPDFDKFRDIVSTSTDLSDWSRANAVEQNVLIYHGPDVVKVADDAKEREEIKSEWMKVLNEGPGIFVVTEAFRDLAVVDTATETFKELIRRQHLEGEQGGDHFAAPGSNDRVWNVFEKHCLANPQNFIDYYENDILALASEAWLGFGYQITAQVNQVNPGGKAQRPHRDYHLGFMSKERLAQYPALVHALSPLLTLQGAVAHCDMPRETGPTMYLPYSQCYPRGYMDFSLAEFQDHFATHYSQLPLKNGDMVFFNPALMHAAGENRTQDIRRIINVLQISSIMGRPMETVNRTGILHAIYPLLLAHPPQNDQEKAAQTRIINACAHCYPFPANLDTHPPINGLAPLSQRDVLEACLAESHPTTEFLQQLTALG